MSIRLRRRPQGVVCGGLPQGGIECIRNAARDALRRGQRLRRALGQSHGVGHDHAAADGWFVIPAIAIFIGGYAAGAGEEEAGRRALCFRRCWPGSSMRASGLIAGAVHAELDPSAIPGVGDVSFNPHDIALESRQAERVAVHGAVRPFLRLSRRNDILPQGASAGRARRVVGMCQGSRLGRA